MLPLLELTFTLVLTSRRLFTGNNCFIPPFGQARNFSHETFDALFIMLIFGADLSKSYFQPLKFGTLLLPGLLGMLNSLLQRSDLCTRRVECCLPVTDLLLRCHFIGSQTFNLVFKATLSHQMGFNFCLRACGQSRLFVDRSFLG